MRHYRVRAEVEFELEVADGAPGSYIHDVVERNIKPSVFALGIRTVSSDVRSINVQILETEQK